MGVEEIDDRGRGLRGGADDADGAVADAGGGDRDAAFSWDDGAGAADCTSGFFESARGGSVSAFDAGALCDGGDGDGADCGEFDRGADFEVEFAGCVWQRGGVVGDCDGVVVGGVL